MTKFCISLSDFDFHSTAQERESGRIGFVKVFKPSKYCLLVCLLTYMLVYVCMIGFFVVVVCLLFVFFVVANMRKLNGYHSHFLSSVFA